jgi:hypothetical protein
MEIKIEKGVPFPTRTRRTGVTAALRRMEVGDSFFVEDASKRGSTLAMGQRIGKAFRTAKEGTGFRIWRTA